MAEMGGIWRGLRSAAVVGFSFLLAIMLASAERNLIRMGSRSGQLEDKESNFLVRLENFLWQPEKSGCTHVWPEMEFGWKIFLGTVIGFFGTAFGSVGGVRRRWDICSHAHSNYWV